MSTCLVTGGAGFIGSHVVDLLVEEGHKVIVVDNLSTGKKENVNPKAEFYKTDASIFAPDNIDYVFHLAARPRVPYSVEHPYETARENMMLTVRIIERFPNARIIFSSSSSVYGIHDTPIMNEEMDLYPLSPYALQKKHSEEYLDMLHKNSVKLRYFNVYGDRMPEEGAYALVIAKFLRQKREGEPFTIYGDGKQTRDYCHVKDVARANVLAMKANVAGEAINIGTGIETSVDEIADLIGGKKKYIKPNPRGKFEEMRKCANISRAKNNLGWKPTISIKQGISWLK